MTLIVGGLADDEARSVLDGDYAGAFRNIEMKLSRDSRLYTSSSIAN